MLLRFRRLIQARFLEEILMLGILRKCDAGY